MRRAPPELGDDISAMFLAEDEFEKMDSVVAHGAVELISTHRRSVSRLLGLRILRFSARTCPNALYNFANILSDASNGRPLRERRAIDMFIDVADIAERRTAKSLHLGDGWPDEEYFIRDIGSRALTNLGAKISNASRPQDAVEYFRRAIAMFDGNSNAHVCLGNMGVYFSETTGIDPLDGFSSWRRAFEMSDPDAGHDGLEPDRRHMVEIVDDLVIKLGQDEARRWLKERFVPILHSRRKALLDLKPLACSTEDVVDRLGGSAAACRLHAMMGEVLPLIARDLPLEQKVTLAASLLLSLLNVGAGREDVVVSILRRASQSCDGIDPAWPLLGDEEWDDVGPPDTDYLLAPETKTWFLKRVSTVLDALSPLVRAAGRERAATAFLLHLDTGFRNGVASMVRPKLGTMTSEVAYLPAYYVGNPAGRPRGV